MRFLSAAFLITGMVVFGSGARSADFFQIKGSDIQYVTAEPVPEAKASTASPAHVILKFRVGEGYHVNSNRPRSDLLIPTQLKLNAPSGITVPRIVYPEGKDFSLSFSPGESLSVYSGEFAIQAILKPLPAQPAGSYRVQGELAYQACSDRACFPPKKLPVSFEVMVLKQQVKSTASAK